MRVYKNKDTIIKHAPQLSEADIQEINEICFTPYLFFHENQKEKCRQFTCTACHSEFVAPYIKRTMSENDYNLIQKKHNEWVRCPHCGCLAQLKEEYRAKECKNLDAWKSFVTIKPVGCNTVYLICGYAHKSYSHANYNAIPITSISAIYYLTPGYVRIFKKDYDYTYLGLKSGCFFEPKSIVEPFTKTYCYNISSYDKRGYYFIKFENLKNTFLRFCPIADFDKSYENWYRAGNYYNSYTGIVEAPDVKFLAYSSIYPGVEKLIKIGLGDFVCSLVDGRPMKRYINWEAPNIQEMLKMRRDEIRDLRENYYGIPDFKVYQILRSAVKNIKYQQVYELCKKFGFTGAERIASVIKRNRLSFKKTLNYLDKQINYCKKGREKETVALWWTDYLNFATQLKYDLTRSDVIFPKKLKEAHDNASAAAVVLADKKAFEKYRERYLSLKKRYEWTDGVFQIVIPQGINDIIQEGKELSHCVGGYAERHVNGKTTILFLRKCSSPTERLVTIEIKGEHICQNYGYKDRLVNKDEREFIDKWITWVRAGSKRDKNKKTNKAVSAA